jgi:diaminopimelate decarboxylase
MNIDVVREQVSLPLLNKGDLLVVHNVGAYNMTQWMQFITLRPNIVMIEENGGTKLIREAEKFDDVTRLERL